MSRTHSQSSSRKQNVLFVLTGHDRLGNADDENAPPTGFHLTEAAYPWWVLTQAGMRVSLVTPDGGTASIDPSSRDDDDAINQAFLEDAEVRATLTNTPGLDQVTFEDYSAVYFPGGHGTMWDLPTHASVASLVQAMFLAGKPIAAICHGPAALVNTRLSNGTFLVAGKRVSAFSDSEEIATDKAALMPFMLESTLRERGALLQTVDDFQPCVVVDGKLITGQNPASAMPLARALLDALTTR